MSSNSLSVRGLGKTFFLYEKPHHRLLQKFSKRYEPRAVSVLTDINLELEPGEIIGFIGRNGAGKTTLLKILSGITPTTCGELHTNGRIASILDLGFGLIEELSGLENIYYIASLKGYARNLVKQKLSEILEFCELGE